MRGELLLDTGALVSLLDRSQTHHLKCRRAFADWTGPVVSTEAVLTEANFQRVRDLLDPWTADALARQRRRA